MHPRPHWPRARPAGHAHAQRERFYRLHSRRHRVVALHVRGQKVIQCQQRLRPHHHVIRRNFHFGALAVQRVAQVRTNEVHAPMGRIATRPLRRDDEPVHISHTAARNAAASIQCAQPLLAVNPLEKHGTCRIGIRCCRNGFLILISKSQFQPDVFNFVLQGIANHQMRIKRLPLQRQLLLNDDPHFRAVRLLRFGCQWPQSAAQGQPQQPLPHKDGPPHCIDPAQKLEHESPRRQRIRYVCIRNVSHLFHALLIC